MIKSSLQGESRWQRACSFIIVFEKAISKRMPKTARLFTSVVRYHVSETAETGIDKTTTAFGGHGHFVDQEVERRYRDNQVLEIYRAPWRFS
jgi:alkylation response protein AidB-like acyl-CoA dehydrogenase